MFMYKTVLGYIEVRVANQKKGRLDEDRREMKVGMGS